MTRFDQWLNIMQARLLAPRCVLCRAPATPNRDLCAGCAQELPWLDAACRHCALPLAARAAASACPACARRPRFDAALAVFVYAPPVNWLIARLKFDGQLAHARLLGDLLARRIVDCASAPADLLVPVPLHARGYRRRGFNQAERIARRLGRTLHRPLAVEGIARLRDTTRQSTLAAGQRAANVRGAFACRRPLTGAHVAIVDDVVTTGQTARALAACLRAAGAARVDLYCVARAQ